MHARFLHLIQLSRAAANGLDGCCHKLLSFFVYIGLKRIRLTIQSESIERNQQ
jgi:hypothetical protein